MSPMTLVDGSGNGDTRLVKERDRAQQRFTELAAAIREHEQSVRRGRPYGVRSQDDHLYRRLRQICGGGHGAD
ncbi:MAG: hypothetical protein AABM29_09490 [Actinomycetota bacterium]